ncbi:hypothetical protein N7G274_005301 [Stereocaulon virgatum]|uniref:Uncharacterized protein n=1 Tax=Stereocaulon virgatum TaxID=373712 RepID=A0ABR4AFF4_9LECA
MFHFEEYMKSKSEGPTKKDTSRLDLNSTTAMDRSPTPAQSLSPSCEAIIRASVAAAIQHHSSSINKPSNTQVEEAVTAVLNQELTQST